ncbi:MAG TPA: Gfo/Idh/MocA family oxidoreductase [Solirubrobacteraceae bacterium]|jgi:predicted dehydrogenase|nr:Gfo/Idh/MocA family oxidoreductase [Solirubrobacteraceae bacterium]
MKILVVGLGSMGRRRLRNLRYLGVKQLAGVEPAPARRAEVAGEFGIPAFATLPEGLAWEPEALVISTPPDQHVGYAIEAARRGLPFFTEAGTAVARMDELIATVRDSRSLGAPSCTLRFHSAVQLMRARLAEGAIGRPLFVTNDVGQYLPDWHPWEDYRSYYVAQRHTGAAREIIPFELNWLTSLFGPLADFSCFRDKLSQLDVDIDDYYAALLRFQNGVQGTLVVDVISRPALRRARIVGEEGTLEWDWNGRCMREWQVGNGSWIEHPDPQPIAGPGGEWVSENMYIEEMRGYLRAIDGREAWPLSLEDDLALVETLDAFDAASQQPHRAAVS